MDSWRRDVRRWFLPFVGIILIAFTPPATQTVLDQFGLWIWFAWVITGVAIAVGAYWTVQFLRARQKAQAWPGWSEIWISGKRFRACVGGDGFPLLQDPGTAPKMRGGIAVDPGATVAASLVDGQVRIRWLGMDDEQLWGPFPAAIDGQLLAVKPDKRNSSIRMVMSTTSTPYEVCVDQVPDEEEAISELDDHSGAAVAAGYLGNTVIWADERGALWHAAGTGTPKMQDEILNVFNAIWDRIVSVRHLDVARYGNEYLVVAAGDQPVSVERRGLRWLRKTRGIAPIVVVFVDRYTYRPTRYAEFGVESEDDVRVRVAVVRQSGEQLSSPPEVITSMGGIEMRRYLEAEDMRAIAGMETE